MKKIAAIVSAVLMLSACAMGSNGAASGDLPSTTATSSSTSGGGEGGGVPCGGCPASPDPCHDVTCVDNSCLLVGAPAGRACVLDGQDASCNGSGACGMTTCFEDSDCGPVPPCYAVTCHIDGPFAHECVAEKKTGGACDDVCDPVIKGLQVDECAGLGTVSFYCKAEDGPPLEPGLCIRSDSQHSPGTWCCAP